jgi:hypothetical protein
MLSGVKVQVLSSPPKKIPWNPQGIFFGGRKDLVENEKVASGKFLQPENKSFHPPSELTGC